MSDNAISMQEVARIVQARTVPDDVHAELRRRAAGAGMTLSDFVLQELGRLARRPSVAELMDRAAAGAGDQLTFSEAREAVVAERAHG